MSTRGELEDRIIYVGWTGFVLDNLSAGPTNHEGQHGLLAEIPISRGCRDNLRMHVTTGWWL